MGDKLAAFLRVVKENQIAGNQIRLVNSQPLGKLGICCPWNGESAVVKYIFHQSGTVKPSRLLPTVDIGFSQLGIGPGQDPAAKLFLFQRF